MIQKLTPGAWTALVTPFMTHQPSLIDEVGLAKLISFQIQNGIAGIVPAGTTGESATLGQIEHERLIERVANHVHLSGAERKVGLMAGCGSNCTDEANNYVWHSFRFDCEAALLVDCYYNCPSSLELSKYYYGKLAQEHPKMMIVPYIIPGRTGCRLEIADLARLALEFPNVRAVKYAGGNLGEMKLIRAATGREFQIFSGDDNMTYEAMITGNIRASGVISVISNIAPLAVTEMCQCLLLGDTSRATSLNLMLSPLFNAVTICADRLVEIPNDQPFAHPETIKVVDKFRNPVPIKTMMRILGMPAGPCRAPLGVMSTDGIITAENALLKVWEKSPEILRPIADFFNVDIDKRLHDLPSIAKAGESI